MPLVVVYVATSIGSISGGWLSSRLIARGWDVTRARQITMLGLAFLVVAIAFSPWIDNMWAMVGLLSRLSEWEAWLAQLVELSFPCLSVRFLITSRLSETSMRATTYCLRYVGRHT
ncbi:membrane hypothetical protein [Paraburkholderia caribensis]|nr:membrane hypothetical protein [Paraburkholderia caribensis]